MKHVPFRYAHVEILTQAVVICGPTRNQLDHGGAPRGSMKKTNIIPRITHYWIANSVVWILIKPYQYSKSANF